MSWLDVAVSSEASYVLDLTRDYMVEHFGISAEEAEARLASWYLSDQRSDPKYDWAIGHETAEYWAHHVYYGDESQWWRVDTSTLTPLPWPGEEATGG